MNWRRWNITVIALAVILLITVVAISEFYLYRLNENLDLQQSVQSQIKNQDLYGRVLLGQDALFKVAMTQALKPDILVLGSSRVMQVRREFINPDYSFYNAGGSIPTLEQGLIAYREISKTYIPKVIILGVDMWWLNPNFNEDNTAKWNMLKSSTLQNRLFLYGSLLDYLKRKKHIELGVNLFSPENYQRRQDRLGGLPANGLVAAIYSDGFRPDGSYQYGAIIQGITKPDVDFKDTLERISTGTRRFQVAKQVDVGKLAQLRELLKMFKNQNVTVIVFTPPFAHVVFEALNQKDQRMFLEDFRNKLKELCTQEDLIYYDFSDITWYGSDDRETIDGFHPSDVSIARLLKTIDGGAGRYFNLQWIDDSLIKTRNPQWIGH